MRKTASLVLIVLLALILVASLVACNPAIQDIDKLPDNVGDQGGGDDPDDVINPSGDAYLRFYFTEEQSSVFSAIEVKNFDISEVHYAIVYTTGNATTEEKGGPLTEDMVHEEDRALLYQKGHHNIRVSVDHNGKKVHGSFALHLQDSADPIELVTLTFDLKDPVTGNVATAYFGTTNSTTNIASVQVEKGLTLRSWTECAKSFRFEMKGMAVSQIKSGNLTLTPSYFENNVLTFDKDMHFTATWTQDIINVTFDLNVPEDAEPMDGVEDPALTFNEDQSVARNIGMIRQPVVDTFNQYHGYYFAGWYVDDGDGDKTNDKLWNFSSRVGIEDIALYAKWTVRGYTYTIYTTGGQYPANISNSEYYDKETGQREYINSDETALKYGLKVVDSTSRFGVKDGLLNRITVLGMKYGDDLAQYVVKVQINANGDMRYLTFRDVLAKLQKGNPDYVTIEFTYSDLQCTEQIPYLVDKDGNPIDKEGNRIDIDKDGNPLPYYQINHVYLIDGIHDICFIKWIFNEPENEFPNYTQESINAIRKDRLSRYITEVVFKDGYTLKQDGTIRLDKIADTSINELALPATIKLDDGIERPITEIAPRACINLKGLVSIDFRDAVYLTTIGAEAFSHCSSLREIHWPGYVIKDGEIESVSNELNRIESIGERAFYRTPYETNYASERGGVDMIMVNKVLYKYIGSTDITSIDLSTSEYYTQSNCTLSDGLRAIYNTFVADLKYIADGAFVDAPNLESIILGQNFETIGANAFVGTKIESVVASNATSLRKVHEAAFDGTPMLTNQSKNYDSTYGAIIVGNIYYRFLNKKAVSAIIPSSVEHIASKAFDGCGEIVNVQFENEANIKTVGYDSFFSTEWIKRDSDGFIMVNGVIAEYYNISYDKDDVNAILPDETKRIATSAFGSYAQYVKTLQFNPALENIAEYAFSGASSLESFIFTDITVSANKLQNAPMINDKSFADAKGNLINNAKFFVRQEVMDCLNLYAQAKDLNAIDDAVTRAWARFFVENTENFIVEDVSKVYVDTSIVSKFLLKTGVTDNAFTDTYGMGVVPGALIIESNTGVLRHEDLDPVANNVKFTQVSMDPANPFASLYEEGKWLIVMTFTYHGSTKGCQINASDELLYVAQITKAIKNPIVDSNIPYLPFYSATIPQYSQSTTNIYNIDGYNMNDNNFWIEGFSDKDFEDNGYGKQIPVFYTSFAGLNVKFGYRNIHGEVKYLDVKVSQFSTSIEKTGAEAILEVNFNGIGVYRFKMQYIVKVSKYVDIEQTSAISVPLNGNATSHFAKYTMDLIGQDGAHTPTVINLSNFEIVSVDGAPAMEVDTTKLGVHTMKVKYANVNAIGVIEKDIVYTVILDADASLFSYEVVNERAGTARIVGCSNAAKLVDTIVLPTRCIIDGKEYVIVELGKSDATRGIFEGFTSLKAVYLSTSIKKINANTFRGCTLLEGVYTAQVANSSFAQLTIDNFNVLEDISSNGKRVINVELANLKGVYGNTVAIGASYNITVGGEVITYNIIKVAPELKLNDNNVEVFMPNTIFNQYTIKDFNGNVVKPSLYSADTGYMFRTQEYVPESISYIGSGAFMNCPSLVNINLTKAIALEYIGANAFQNTALKEIDLSYNTMLDTINNETFKDCVALTKVKFNSKVKNIGLGAFNGCVSLCDIDVATFGSMSTDVVTNELSVEHIGKDAFGQCTSLYIITLTENIKSIDSGAFAYCTALVLRVPYQENRLPSDWNPSFVSPTTPVVWDCNNNLNNVASDGNTYYYENGIMYAYVIGSGVATVARQQSCVANAVIADSFTGIDNMKYTVTTVGAFAFADNSNLTSVTLGKNVTTIKQEAFSTCTSLVEVKGGDALTDIAETAFEYCDLLEVVPTV